MVVYQQVENYLLQPTIIGKATNVSGFTVLVSVLVFGSLFGIVGAIIGVPTAAIEIIIDESTASRRALIAADDAARDQPVEGRCPAAGQRPSCQSSKSRDLRDDGSPCPG